MKTFLSILFLFVGEVCWSQMNWHNVDSLFGSLPNGVQVFCSKDALDGKPFIGYYVRLPLQNKQLNFTAQAGKRMTPSQYFEKEDSPLVVVNCTFFSFADSRNLNLVMREGKQVAYNIPAIRQKTKTDSSLFAYPTRSALGIAKNRAVDIGWIYTDTASRWPYVFAAPAAPQWSRGRTSDPVLDSIKVAPDAMVNGRLFKKWKMWTAVGGGPILLQDGQVRITNKEEMLFANGENDKHPRTAMGYTANGDLIILCVQGRFSGIAEGASLVQEAKMLQALGCVEALNLDGGGSSCLLINGKETIKPCDKEGQRPVPAVFLVHAKK
jgi:hypothetical protein